jgi:hypothetical protein
MWITAADRVVVRMGARYQQYHITGVTQVELLAQPRVLGHVQSGKFLAVSPDDGAPIRVIAEVTTYGIAIPVPPSRSCRKSRAVTSCTRPSSYAPPVPAGRR